ncbi:LysR family transcriptional regulator [Sporolactobacillus sp. Y61]|uniref:LysR family transcriptional regulator n=1 Tax=Sporolactobacillus sp. Y61 TaxID=3160863 RepID=A0AAU8IIQ1_9BACL
MSLIKYQILVKVVACGSFTKAAGQLGLTQPAVSHAINSLETEFGFPLINRNRSGIQLTREGEILLPSLRRILQEDRNIHQQASEIHGTTRGTLHVGIFTSVTRHLLPRIIQVMDKDYSGIRLYLHEGNYIQIMEQISAGKLDCGFITFSVSKDLRCKPLMRDRILCIVSPRSALYHQEAVSFRQLEEEPFIMPAFGGYHEIRRILSEHDVHPDIRFELMEENAILSMVAHHLGISILPELVLPEDIAPLRAIPLESESYRTIQIATRLHPSPAAERFVEVAERVVKKQEVSSENRSHQ